MCLFAPFTALNLINHLVSILNTSLQLTALYTVQDNMSLMANSASHAQICTSFRYKQVNNGLQTEPVALNLETNVCFPYTSKHKDEENLHDIVSSRNQPNTAYLIFFSFFVFLLS